MYFVIGDFQLYFIDVENNFEQLYLALPLPLVKKIVEQ
jgi:hypothetical protein